MTTTKQNWLKRSLSLLLALVLCVSMVSVTAFAAEQEDTSAAVTINDENLRKAVCASLGKEYSEGITVTENEMASLIELVAEDAGITDLTGLEYAANLETLDLSGNDALQNIRKFFTALSNSSVPNLKSLNLSRCNLSKTSGWNISYLGYLEKLENLNLSDNGFEGVFNVTVFGGTTCTYENLKILDLSDNNISGISFTGQVNLTGIQKIDLRRNRIWMNENAGDWYKNVVELGLDKVDYSEQKDLTELRGIYVEGVTSGYEPSYIDNKNRVINLGKFIGDTVTVKLCGYGEIQTMSALIDDADMPVMIASPSTSAAPQDNCLFTLSNLKMGNNSYRIALTHGNGTEVTYTLQLERVKVPSDDNEQSAGIRDKALQQAVCKEVGKDYLTEVVTIEDMKQLTSLSITETVYDLSGIQYAENLVKLSVTNGQFTEVPDLSKLTQLTSLTLEGKYTSLDGLEKMDKDKMTILQLSGEFTEQAEFINAVSEFVNLNSLKLVGSFQTSPSLGNDLSKLVSLETNVAEDRTIPTATGLPIQKLVLQNCQNGFQWSDGFNGFQSLNWIEAKDYAGTLLIPEKFGSISSNSNIIIYGAEEKEVEIDFSNVSEEAENITLNVYNKTNNDTSKNTKKVTLKGMMNGKIKLDINRADSVEFADGMNASFSSVTVTDIGRITLPGGNLFGNLTSLTLNRIESLAFDEDFCAPECKNLTITGVNDKIVLPQAVAFPNLTTLKVSGSKLTEDGSFPTSMNDYTTLKTIELNGIEINNLEGMDFSNCTALTSLTIKSCQSLNGNIDGSMLPSSLTKLSLLNDRLEGLTGDWSHLTKLTELNFTLNYMSSFPSEAVRQLTALKTLYASENLYTDIAENTFENSSNLKTVQLGDWMPVVKTDSGWMPSDNSSAGKAIKKLMEVAPKVKIQMSIGPGYDIATGNYSGLLAITSNNGEIAGNIFTERDLSVVVPTSTESLTFTPTALLEDTVITVDGKTYRSGDEITVSLPETINTITISCYNDYINYMNVPKKTDYVLTVIAGEYMENFEAQEGHSYNIDFALLKIDGTTSMANEYFKKVAQVKYSDGKYEIRYTTIKPDWITDMLYGNDNKKADIIGGDEVTTREYRIYADSLIERIPITPKVVPMGSYATCYMVFDPEKAIDITDSVGVDKADLNAAINKAVEITEKNNVYTSDSYTAMLAVLEEAQKVAELSTPMQSAVDNAKNKLMLAIESLVVDESKLAVKLALETALSDAKAVVKGNHTDTAWNALQKAIADAQAVYDTLEARQSEVDAAVKALNTAVTLFNSSGEASTLDKNNLADGVYSLNVEMIKTSRNEYSMANNAINHTVKLEVINGEYYITLDFRGITIENRFGYLKNLSYYADGYVYGQYGTVEGTLVPAEVLSTQKDADGNDVIDQYNDEDNLYPDLVRIKVVPDAIADEDGYVPLHVFVPIMEAIAEGNGDQDVLLKLDWSTLKKTTEDDPAFLPEEPVEQSPAMDYTDKTTGVIVHADKGVFDEGVQVVITEITKGTDYDNAVLSLSDVGKKFKLYDIKFLDKDGKEVAPNGTVTISFPIAEGYDSAKLAVYRINEDGSKTLVKGTVENGFYKIITKTAAKYALVEKDNAITDKQNAANVSSGTNSGTKTNLQTGDNSNIMLWLMLILASAGMLGVLTFARRRRYNMGE